MVAVWPRRLHRSLAMQAPYKFDLAMQASYRFDQGIKLLQAMGDMLA